MTKEISSSKPANKILLAAFHCLANNGYANVTMRNIAEEAGVALSQLTYYYKTKEALFLEVINLMIEKYMAELEEKLKTTDDRKEKFKSLISFFKELLVQKPELFKIFVDFTAQSLWIPSFCDRLEHFFQQLAKLIEVNIVSDNTPCLLNINENPSDKAKLILGALYGASIQLMLSSDGGLNLDLLNSAERLLNYNLA